MTDQVLTDVRVVEYASLVAGPCCGKVLADLGAEVIKIESPGMGDEARREGVFRDDLPNGERSTLFLYLNRNKMGVTLDARNSAARKIFERIVEQADILIEDMCPGEMQKLGLDFENLKRVNPRLIMVSITPFGQTGPYSRYKSYPLTTFHASGEAYMVPCELGWQLYPDMEPLKIGGFVGEYNAGIAAANAALVALYGRESLDSAQHIDVSKQEALLNLIRLEHFAYNEGIVVSRATKAWPIGGIMFCRDGFVVLLFLNQHLWERFVTKVLGSPEWAAQERFSYTRLAKSYVHPNLCTDDLYRDQGEVNEHLQEWSHDRTMEEIYYTIQEAGSAAATVATTADLLKSRQLRARNFFVEVDHPQAGKAIYPGVPYKLSETPSEKTCPAPLLGQHNEEVYCHRLGFSREDLVKLRMMGCV